MTTDVVGSVVIPAHQEEAVIGRCLRALLDGPNALEVVVVVNGSTDGTADRAREVPVPPGSTVDVIELAVGSKPMALSTGDRHVSAFPRLFVDADVVCDNKTVGEMCRALSEDNGLEATAPRLEYDTSASPWIVAAYSRVWLALHNTPWLVGSGVYGLSEQGRGRFGTFPSALADDAFVRTLFDLGERKALDVTFTAFPPRRVVDLVKRKSRVFLSHHQLEHDGVELDLERNVSPIGLVLSRDRPPLAELLAYLAVTVVSKTRARIQWWQRRTDRWERDQSSRVA